MKNIILRPHPDKVYPGAYVYGEAVPVNIFIDGQKVEAPKAGIKVGVPMFPDVEPDKRGIIVGDFCEEEKAIKGGAGNVHE